MRAFGLCAVAALAVSCGNFPVIESGVCGNAVIDANEDCDSFAADAKEVCRPPGTDNACHYDCSPGPKGPPMCPQGWGCNSDGICRAPTATFDASSAVDVGAWNLTAGNFDGDARGDIMSSEPVDSIGGTLLRFFYFDQNGQVADTRPFPKLLLSPVVKDVSGDGLSDVTFAYGHLSLMLGRKDRSWVPETFASYQLPHSQVRMVSVFTHRIQSASPIVPLVDGAKAAAFFVVNPEGKLDARATVAGKVADLVGDPSSGNVFEDAAGSPCLEPVYALKGASHFTVVNACQTAADGSVVWRQPFESTDIPLQPAVAIDAAPQVVDMNHDGHLDVLLGAGGKPYVAYGNGQQLAPAVPYQLPLASTANDMSREIPMPLAVGDFSGDGEPDFVFPDYLLVSGPSPDGASPFYVTGQRNSLGAPYTAAIIADFNGNGFLDVVAASSGSLDLEFFNGQGTPDLTETRIATGNPVQFLAAADYDGDLITDLALLETTPAGETTSALRIAFGSPFALPAAPITVARVTQPEQLMSYAQDGIGNMVVTSQQLVQGVANGAVTFLDGSGDRLPSAALALTEFSSNGSIEDSSAVAVAAGSFRNAAQSDVLALGMPNRSLNGVKSALPKPWLVPNILGAGATSQRLPDDLDARLNPVLLELNTSTVDITSASADLNGDGLDEGILAMAAGAQQDQCGVVVYSAARAGASELKAQPPVLLNEPCAHPQLAAVDLDADQRPELALLTGEVGGTARKLYVLWNDGAGGFDPEAVTLVSDAQDSPQAFTVLPATAPNRSPKRTLSLAYVTSSEVRYAAVGDGARTFAPALSIPGVQLFGGTGIAASDVNGDGVPDLVVAESGKLLVLKAHLEAL